MMADKSTQTLCGTPWLLHKLIVLGVIRRSFATFEVNDPTMKQISKDITFCSILLILLSLWKLSEQQS